MPKEGAESNLLSLLYRYLEQVKGKVDYEKLAADHSIFHPDDKLKAQAAEQRIRRGRKKYLGNVGEESQKKKRGVKRAAEDDNEDVKPASTNKKSG
jgi:hypothetical protein